MSIAEVFHWIQETGWATNIRESGLTYPVIMSLHLSSIAFFGGMILMTNLRLLNLAMTGTPVNDLIRQLRPWKWAGFVIMVTCGILLASSKADTYYPSPYFRIKMALLFLIGVHGLFFRRSVYGEGARSATGSGTPRNATIAACLSIALWVGMISMGRWIAYYEAPKDATAAQLTVR